MLEEYHAGRTVPCPWCRASSEVPKSLDFATVQRDQMRDEARGGTMLVLAVLGMFIACLPLSAWVWWSCHGTLTRAADAGRPGDGLLRAARVLAILGTVIWGLIAALAGAAALA